MSLELLATIARNLPRTFCDLSFPQPMSCPGDWMVASLLWEESGIVWC